MVMVDVDAAKTRLSNLVELMEAGEEVIIVRAGAPVARLAPHAEARQARRKPGRAAATPPTGDDEATPMWGEQEWAQWEAEWGELLGPTD